MGKKGTKRKTKWRALPLGEEAGGSGNEEEIHDEDQSTTSSVAGQPTSTFKTPAIFCKMGEKPYRQNRRFPYDRYKNKEPLVKLESKTFDEEEYTKITTPRQDVLFKKGYFGRKRESSVEESALHSGELEGEEPMMDQIIITNGFVDERGHYLVNGNSYEIYDPYSNTVTVVVGPPPYTNGVTQPVLAAVSCQPVPLQPVDWYPPGTDWPSQGSAWTASYPRPSQPESINSPGQNCENAPSFHGSDGQIPNLYHQPAYVVPGYMFSESPVYNGVPVHTNNYNPTTEAMCSNDKSKNAEKSMNPKGEPVKSDKLERTEEESKSQKSCDGSAAPENGSEVIAAKSPTESQPFEGNHVAFQVRSENKPNQTTQNNNNNHNNSNNSSSSSSNNNNNNNKNNHHLRVEGTVEFRPKEKQVEKQSHSTQTGSVETNENISHPKIEIPDKESHSTQTQPEQIYPMKKAPVKTQNECERNESNSSVSEILSSPTRGGLPSPKTNWKATPQNKYKEYTNSNGKKQPEDSPRKIYQKRTNFGENEKNYKTENFEKVDPKTKANSSLSPLKISYAKKAMVGLEIANDKNSKVVNGVIQTLNNRIPNGLKNAQNNLTNGTNETNQLLSTNEMNKTNYTKKVTNDRYDYYEEKRNFYGTAKNGYVKPRYNKSSYGNKPANERVCPKDFRCNDRKAPSKPFEVLSEKVEEVKRKCDEIATECRSVSEKSSTVSELSSPTELSSGQNTPPEKLIVRKMEQKIANEINKSFEKKLKQNLTKKNEEAAVMKEVEEKEHQQNSQGVNEKAKQKQEGKKRNQKEKPEMEKAKEVPKGNKKKKKKVTEEPKEKAEPKNLDDSPPFLSDLIVEKPQNLLFRSIGGMQEDQVGMISDMDSILTEGDEILKTLGISEDKMNLSKLPLHSDMIMMMPAFGWSRPKFKFEDVFAPTKHLHNDLFTRRNITSMKSTKPEEFFASVIDHPVVEKSDRKKDNGNKNGKKVQAKPSDGTAKENVATSKKTPNTAKSGDKSNKNVAKPKRNKEEARKKKSDKENKENKEEKENRENKYGIVEAVNTWLQEQSDSEKVLSVDSLAVQTLEALTKAEATMSSEDSAGKADLDPDQKNGTGNPMRALSGSKGDSVSIADFQQVNARIRVANVISDGFVHVDKEFDPKNISRAFRMYRSSSWDAKLSETKIKKHFKFLTDSASYCQDLISDVRNGLPTKSEYATEELCDPKQGVPQYYTLSPNRQNGKVKTVHECDSDSEVFDALEYKFLTKENITKQETEGRASDRNGNASITDSGVHSDMDSSEDTANELQKDVSCKLQ